jgi:hypothetical protein
VGSLELPPVSAEGDGEPDLDDAIDRSVYGEA